MNVPFVYMAYDMSVPLNVVMNEWMNEWNEEWLMKDPCTFRSQDTNIGVPVTMCVDPKGYFVYWHDQNQVCNALYSTVVWSQILLVTECRFTGSSIVSFPVSYHSTSCVKYAKKICIKIPESMGLKCKFSLVSFLLEAIRGFVSVYL